MLAIFLAALLFGFAFNVSPGAVFSETLRRGLTGGFRPALLVQLGSLIGDAVWALLGLTGLALLLGYEQVRIPLTLACAAYLAWLGVQGLRDAWSPPLAAEDAGEQGRNAFGAGAAISLSNPKNVVYWGAPRQRPGGDRRRHAEPGAVAGVLRRFHALVADLVLLLRGAGGLAAAQHLAVLAPRQLRRLRRAPARPGGTGAARAVAAPQAGARRRRSRRWRRLSNLPRSTCRAWSPTTIRPSGSSAQCCSPPSRSSSP